MNQDHLSTLYASSQVGFQVEHSPPEEGDFGLNANCNPITYILRIGQPSSLGHPINLTQSVLYPKVSLSV